MTESLEGIGEQSEIDELTKVDGPEREVALDMARLGLMLGPAFVIVSGLIWGLGGLASSALAFVIVVTNLLLGAWVIGRAAAVSPNLLMGAVLGGFLFRLMAMSAVVLPIRDLSWFHAVPFAVTLVGGHLGLLAWETTRVSITLAYPGLPPKNATALTNARPRSESTR
jgi:hypothetical protein